MPKLGTILFIDFVLQRDEEVINVLIVKPFPDGFSFSTAESTLTVLGDA